jgi:hypothetical protein
MLNAATTLTFTVDEVPTFFLPLIGFPEVILPQ